MRMWKIFGAIAIAAAIIGIFSEQTKKKNSQNTQKLPNLPNLPKISQEEFEKAEREFMRKTTAMIPSPPVFPESVCQPECCHSQR